MNTNLRGIGFILLSGIILALNDAVYKSLVPHYPVGQILFIIASGVALLIWLVLGLRRGAGVRVKSWAGHIARGLFFVVASFAFVISLKYLTLAETICIAFSGPLFMTLLARQFLNEQVGTVRLAAVLIGFIGVVIIIQPGTSHFRWVLLLPLLVGFGDAARDVITRKIAPGESSLSIVFTTSFILALAGLITYPLGWNAFQLPHLVRMLAGIFLTVAAYFYMVEAYRYSQAVVIAPFRYIQIIWGILAGYLIWGEVPGSQVYVGIFIIVGAGIFIAYREMWVKGST